MPTASMPPSDFVSDIAEDGWTVVRAADQPSPVVLDQYLCAVGKYGGNANAVKLMQAVREVVKKHPGETLISDMGNVEFSRLFTGQGKVDYVQDVMQYIADNEDDFRKVKDGTGKPFLAGLLDEDNPYQVMVDKRMFGLDCIGFIGRYLEAAGVVTEYPAYYPRNYLDLFLPVRGIADVDDLCVAVFSKGDHIVIIDSVDEVHTDDVPKGQAPYAWVTICQSSSGGPQTNERVKLTEASGEYIDFGTYGREAGRVDSDKSLSAADKEAEKEKLRKQDTRSGTWGYRGGRLFNLQLGSPPAPVTGLVFVGKMKDLTKGYS
jgi:hypothetical protein